MITINDYYEAIAAYMVARKESIYSNGDVASKFDHLSQIIISLLKHHNLSKDEMVKMTNVTMDDVINSIDCIVDCTYKKGFIDGISFKQDMEGTD